MAHMFYGTGWLPDPFNEQDLQYQPRSDLVAKASRNLRTDNDTKDSWESRTVERQEKEKANAKKNSTTYQEFEPLVLNQYSLGSCVANATAAAYAYELRRANAASKGQKSSSWFLPSRTFIYYNARQAMNEPVMSDNGSHNRNAMKSLHKLGVISEEVLPYPFNPEEVNHIWDAKDTEIKNSCKAHLQQLSADDVFGAFKYASEQAAKAKKPVDPATVSKAEGLKSTNEIDKLRDLCVEYINSLPTGEPGWPLNYAWYDILRKAARAKSALYPGIHRYLAAKYFRIAKYVRLDAQRTYKQQLEWIDPKTRNVEAMDKDGERLKENVKKALTDGHPVVFGFRFYAENTNLFQQDENTKMWSVIPLKDRHQWPSSDWGGHAVVAVGYDDKNIIVLNSWGRDWGNAGTFLMPWGWITDFAATRDFWILESFRDISNVDDEDIKDMKKDLFEFSQATVQKQTELKSTQNTLVAAKQKLAKYDSTTNTSTKYDAPVIGQALTTEAIEKMKLEDVQKGLYTAQKNLFEVEKQLRPLNEELAAVNQKLEKYETKKP